MSYYVDLILCGHVCIFLQTWPFHRPVNAKNVPDYYEIVQQPMDLEKLRNVRILFLYTDHAGIPQILWFDCAISQSDAFKV